MSQQDAPHDVESDTRADERRRPEVADASLTDDLDGFEAEVPAERPSSPTQDDWPDGEPAADPGEALVTPEDQVGPAIGQRFADLHAERPWLLPGIAAGAALALAGLVVLLRRR